MPIGYRLLQAATALVLAGQAYMTVVFTFFFNTIAGFAPLDEPAESVAARVRISMAFGAAIIAVALWACAMLVRACVRGTSARAAVAVAATMELLLVASALLRGSESSALMRGTALVMLVLCLPIDPAHRGRGRRVRGARAVGTPGAEPSG
ncbi:hypothetical protein AB0O67_21970 [Streptomyces sp. NPDC086077]|uniref:hypothetical protein n=1 Tax=Streptomyces sp. NPDC086077 TaxID=3154862 RepID=UPI003449C520